MPETDFLHSRFFVLQLVFVALVVLTSSVVVFSQTPRKIAFTHGGSAFAQHIAVINEDGAGFQELTNGNRDVDPAWSPDGSQIVFSGERIGGHNIIRMNADGTGQVPLTSTIFPVTNGEPAWSPDGTKIAFTSSRAGDGRNEIWVMNADGTNPVRLTINPQLGGTSSQPVFGMDFGPAWSPDGTKIVFWSARDNLASSEIYVMNADGSNQVRITNDAAEDRDPIWTRDGLRITFSSRNGGKSEIVEIDANGTNRRHITDGTLGDWSPDGQILAHTDFDPDKNFALALYLVNADGTGREKLTDDGIDSWLPVWQTLGGPAPPPPPAGPLFTVTGGVVDTSIAQNGPGVPGVTISLTGSKVATTTTDANGLFSFTGLPENGNFALVASHSSYTFFPTSITFSTSPPLIGFVGTTISVRFDAAPIFLVFLSATNTGFEGSSAFITVQRFGATQGTSTIDYTTSDGTAVAGSDYVATSGTLVFNPGDQLKSFQVPLIYDKVIEPTETINLTLSNPTGSIVRGLQTAVLEVSDPFPQLARDLNSSNASAVNALTFVRDPFPLTTTFLGQTSATRVSLFARFVDLVAGEDLSVVSVKALTPQQVEHDLPVEFVGKVPGLAGKVPSIDELTQINVRLPADLPVGDLFVRLILRGRSSELVRIRIK
jgi:Tol biopolymer transport system component